LEAAVLAPHRADVVAEAALRYFRTGLLKEAQELLRTTDNANPAVYNGLLVRLTEACIESGHGEAVSYLWPRIHRFPQATSRRMGAMIEGMLQREWYTRAARASADAAVRYPDHPDILLYAAKAHLADSSFESAARYLDRAHNLGPTPETWYYRAVLDHRAGNPDAALAALEKALLLDPGHDAALSQWVRLAAATHPPDVVEARWRAVGARNPALSQSLARGYARLLEESDSGSALK
jgi:tetratricopeptide (TPR) repeat protein